MIGHLLNSAAVVYRPSFTADGRGGRATSWSTVGTIRVKVGQPSAEEREIAARGGADLTHVIHASHGVDVRRGDELDVGGPRRMRVVSVVTDSHRSYLRIGCEVMQGG